MKFIELSAEQSENLDIEFKDASDLLYQDIAILMEWAEQQDSEFFVDLSLQEVLNVYRATIEYDDFEDFLEVNPVKAVEAYNNAVEDDNKMETN